jgi:hypothetical protein
VQLLKQLAVLGRAVMLYCYAVLPAAEMAIMMYVQGRADLGMGAALKAIPLALGLAVAAKALVDRQLQTRWVLGGRSCWHKYCSCCCRCSCLKAHALWPPFKRLLTRACCCSPCPCCSKWAPLAIGAVGVLLLFLSRMVFARPRPSPLDPMFRQLNQERTAVVAEQRRSAAEAQQRRHLLQQPDAERGRALQQEQQQRAARRQ